MLACFPSYFLSLARRWTIIEHPLNWYWISIELTLNEHWMNIGETMKTDSMIAQWLFNDGRGLGWTDGLSNNVSPARLAPTDRCFFVELLPSSTAPFPRFYVPKANLYSAIRNPQSAIVGISYMKNYVLNNWRQSLYKGTLNSSVLRVGEIFREAIRCNAAAIIVVHNRPCLRCAKKRII